MKIVVHSDRGFDSGAAIAAYRFAEQSAKAGHDVRYTYSVPSRQPPKSPFSSLDVRHLTGGGSSLKRIVTILSRAIQKFTPISAYRRLNFWIFCRMVDKWKPDVISIHNCDFSHNEVKTLASKYPVAWTMHDCSATHFYNYKILSFNGHEKTYIAKGRVIDQQALACLLDCSEARLAFITPSGWLANYAADVVKSRKPITVVPNGISRRDFFSVDKEFSRNIIGVPKDGFYLLYLASTYAVERKNFAVIEAALTKVQSDVKVIVIGGGLGLNSLRDPRVFPLKSTSDIGIIRAAYNAADVFCVSSVADNLPNTVLESMFCGTPVLGASAGGIPEMVIDSNTGWLFDPYDADDLAAKIDYIAANADERVRIGSQCLNWATDRFSEENMVDGYVRVFESLKN